MKLTGTIIPGGTDRSQWEDVELDVDLSLRDMFAAFALVGVLTGPDRMMASGNSDKAAAWAYEHADAMLKARTGESK